MNETSSKDTAKLNNGNDNGSASARGDGETMHRIVKTSVIANGMIQHTIKGLCMICQFVFRSIFIMDRDSLISAGS